VLSLFDTATGRVEPLETRDDGQVSMYICGPTVYGDPHLGHGRFALVFDVLRRYLEFAGNDVDHVSNITDIDDKIIERAAREGRTEADVADEYEKVWWEAMDGLGVLRPTEVPHATSWVEEMIQLIQGLVTRGIAYETSDGVYLLVEGVEGYGLLKHQSLDSLRAGERVEVNEDKRSPLDFALWKKAKPGEPTWDSPWGPGRPGWHTECVVMSLGLLGDDFDLHGGAIDLIFPHHENERAQAIAMGRAFARHWVHNGWVMSGGEKMSKSIGNVSSLTDLVRRGDGRAYRLLVLQAHYRKPMEVTEATLGQATGSLERLDALARRFELPTRVEQGTAEAVIASGADSTAVESFRARMDDDLDTVSAAAQLFELVTAANAAADRGEGDTALEIASTVQALFGVLGLEIGGHEEHLDDEVRSLVSERDEARRTKDWARADQIRDKLASRGWVVEDGPQGTQLHR